MCDIIQSNFEEFLPTILEHIKDAAFVAIDGEFTGLSTSMQYEATLFDNPADRYRKLRMSLAKFIMCQFGISVFVPDKTQENKYLAYTYNFYIFPKSFGPINPKFSCQSSALEFLSNHDFDFNKFIHDGVPYMNKDQENLLRKYHADNSVHQHIPSTLMRQLDENYIIPSLSKIDEFLKTHLNDCVYEIKSIPKGLVQYVLLKTIEKRFCNISCQIQENGTIVVKKVFNLDEKISFHSEYEKIFIHGIGFSKIIQTISDLKKPLVGHNCLSDLLLIYNQFFHKLPENYIQFKKNVNRLFPELYDTKHMACVLQRQLKNVDFFESTSLEDLYKVFSSPAGLFYKLDTPHIHHADGYTKYADNKCPHEAGFDAFMTGYVFLRFAHVIATKDISSVDSHPCEFYEHLAAVKPMKNCINIAKASVRYLNFGSSDPPIVLPERFVVTAKNANHTVTPSQVAQDFLPFGSVDVQALSSSQALVAVSHRKRARDIVKAFQRHKYYSVVKYSWFKHSDQAKTIYICSGASCLLMVVAGLTFLAVKRPQIS